jgi:zinc and cadmium transporter
MTLGWILAASFAGGTLSAGLAAFSLTLRASWVPMLVSYAIGALLGAAFLGVIPEAFAKGPPQQAAAAILGGIFGFFVLEKLLLYRHCHTGELRGATTSTSTRTTTAAAGALIIGRRTRCTTSSTACLIAAAFLAKHRARASVTAIAIVAHEIPQEVGDFLILLHSGYSRRAALAINLPRPRATIVGGVVGYFGLQFWSRPGNRPARRGRCEHDLRRRGRSRSPVCTAGRAARHRGPRRCLIALGIGTSGWSARCSALGLKSYSVSTW